MASIRNEDAIVPVNASLLEGFDFLEEAWYIDDAAGADEIDAAGSQYAGCWGKVSAVSLW